MEPALRGAAWPRALPRAGLGANRKPSASAPFAPRRHRLLLPPHPSGATSQGSPWEGGSGLCPPAGGDGLWPGWPQGQGKSRVPIAVVTSRPGKGTQDGLWTQPPPPQSPPRLLLSCPLITPSSPGRSRGAQDSVGVTPANTPQEKGTVLGRCILRDSQLCLMPWLGH